MPEGAAAAGPGRQLQHLPVGDESTTAMRARVERQDPRPAHAPHMRRRRRALWRVRDEGPGEATLLGDPRDQTKGTATHVRTWPAAALTRSLQHRKKKETKMCEDELFFVPKLQE